MPHQTKQFLAFLCKRGFCTQTDFPLNRGCTSKSRDLFRVSYLHDNTTQGHDSPF